MILETLLQGSWKHILLDTAIRLGGISSIVANKLVSEEPLTVVFTVLRGTSLTQEVKSGV